MRLSSPVRLLSSSDGSSTSNEAAVLGITYGPRGEVCLTTADAVTLFDSAAIAAGSSTTTTTTTVRKDG